MPNGRCRTHGGKSPGAPKGNSHAFRHGRYNQNRVTPKEWLAKVKGPALGRM
jgi:hypothetical protein